MMRPGHACKLLISLVALEDMISNVQVMQAVAMALSPYVVIRAQIDPDTQMLEQLLWDPSGERLPKLDAGQPAPHYMLVITKSLTMSVHDNPYIASLTKRP